MSAKSRSLGMLPSRREDAPLHGQNQVNAFCLNALVNITFILCLSISRRDKLRRSGLKGPLTTQ